jgi:predicted O-methyltransferase YrrM
MMRWPSDIFKHIRLHHLLRTIQNPKRAIRELKYRYTFTKKEQFCSLLSGAPLERVYELLQELRDQVIFRDTVKEGLERLRPGANRGEMGDEADILYVLIRLLKPQQILETGVGAGVSSAFMLQALHKNGSGRLTSIDLPDEGGLSGWAVPTELHEYWDLHLGPSSQLLEQLLNHLTSIDMFVHDSDHSYDNMMYEFKAVWPFIRSGGLFLAHDIGRNDALFDFCKYAGISWTRVRTFPVLGGIRKDEVH